MVVMHSPDQVPNMVRSPNLSNGNGSYMDRDNRETSANGFTALNKHGNTTPPSPSGPFGQAKEARMANSDRPVPRSVPIHDHHPAGSGADQDRQERQERQERDYRTERTGDRRSASPMGGPPKKRRSQQSPSDEEEEEDDESEMESGYGHDMHRNGSWSNPQRISDDNEETRLVQALRPNGNNGHDHHHSSVDPHENGSPSDEFITTAAGVKVNPGKRKRAFTNRTKTGCQTCRRRKKKCDEAKPQCQNCTRGGFVCEGYTAQKLYNNKNMPPKSSPMPIQSKDYGETGNGYPRLDTVNRGPPPSHFPGTPPNQYPRQFDDDMHESSRSWGGGNTTPYSAGPNRHPSYSADRHHDHGHSHVNGNPSRPPVPSYSSLNAMHTAQQALSYSGPNIPGRPIGPGSRKSEKKKMIDGEEYLPADAELASEREKCREQVNKFNANTNVSREERERQLRLILNPNSTSAALGGGMMQTQPLARLGQRVTVEAPFRCDYGYKLTLQDDVIIESGCIIAEAKEVRIGKGAYIGPDVKISSKTLPYMPADRMGPQGKAKGIAIHIGEYAYIGMGCVIAPHWDNKDGILKIGPGSYVMPGTVVTRDVAPETVFGVRDRDGPEDLGSVAKRNDEARRARLKPDIDHY